MNSLVPSASDLEGLRRIPLFAGLSDDALRRVRSLAAEVEIPAGQTLVHAGDPGSGIYVIEEGTVVVEGRGSTSLEVGEGEFVGELAILVPEAVRSARVRARTDVRCLAIGATDFRQLLADEPRIALAMLPVVAERLWRVRSDG